MTRFFQKSVDITNNKECFNYIRNHFHYYTLNSWNGLKSIANNVKLYNLPFKRHKWEEVMEALDKDDYMTVNNLLEDFETEWNVRIGFNGKGGGYLVLYNIRNNGHVFSQITCSPYDYDDYDTWKQDVREYYGSLKVFHNELEWEVNLVRAFDKLCDTLIDVCDELVDVMTECEEI